MVTCQSPAYKEAGILSTDKIYLGYKWVEKSKSKLQVDINITYYNTFPYFYIASTCFLTSSLMYFCLTVFLITPLYGQYLVCDLCCLNKVLMTGENLKGAVAVSLASV